MCGSRQSRLRDGPGMYEVNAEEGWVGSDACLIKQQTVGTDIE